MTLPGAFGYCLFTGTGLGPLWCPGVEIIQLAVVSPEMTGQALINSMHYLLQKPYSFCTHSHSVYIYKTATGFSQTAVVYNCMNIPAIIKAFLMTLIIPVIFFGCRHSPRRTAWTEKQKQAFAQKCSQTDTVDNLTFMLTGFEYNEIKNVGVRQIHNGHIIDSFYVHPHQDSFDSSRTRYSARIDRPINVKDTYQFLIPGYNPFILSDMKMIMWDESTYSEYYGCVMGDYQIDGVRFEDDANPDFIKKGFRFQWDK
jgi:hypothetical protein